MVQLIQIIISLLTLGFTIWIPIKVSWEQQYSSLLDEYRGFDYAIAYQGIVQFFANECGGDMERVKEVYKNRFLDELENRKPEEIKKEQCLHFQRRLLAQFFWQLNECTNHHVITKKRIARDFSNAEANLVKILIYMGEAIDNDEIMYKDISSAATAKRPDHLRGQNKGLSEMYQILKQSKRYIG